MTLPARRSPRRPLLNQVALVTGSGRRIGRAIAIRLAQDGFAIALHHHSSQSEAGEAEREIIAAGGAACLVRADLTQPESAAGVVAATLAAFGRLDLLVNNAAMFHADSIESLEQAVWRRQFAVNLEAPVFLSAEFAKALPAGSKGAIVNIIDNRVLRLTPQNISYTLSKSALWTATQTMAQALAPLIRVNAVGPGPTFANALQGVAGLAREAAAVLLQRTVSGDEIAEAVVYLAGASSVTGQFIAVDAGQHLAWRTPDIID
jgi:NAD(P)-dependent dehydrogenase (short-subunit alcohol dehydrogenase family)